MTPFLDQILSLRVAERILLVEAIWDSIPQEAGSQANSTETEKLIEQRLALHRAEPLTGASWEEVKARIQQKL